MIIFGGGMVIIPSLLAGIRDVSVGIDNIAYRDEFLLIASVSDMRQLPTVTRHEPLYSLLCYVVSRKTTDYHVLCFFTELITMLFVVLGVYHMKRHIKNLSVPLSILTWMCYQYCNFLNLVRQGISVAIVFYAMRYILERKPVKFAIWVLIACMFHHMAILGFLLYFIYLWSTSHYSGFKIFAFLCVSSVILLCFPYALRFAINVRLLSGSYTPIMERQINWLSPRTYVHPLSRLPVLFLAIVMYPAMSKTVRLYPFWFSLLCAEYVISQVGLVYHPAYRISLYCWLSNMIVVPSLIRPFSKEDRAIAIMLVSAYLFAYWVLFAVFNAYLFTYPVYPFVSDVL